MQIFTKQSGKKCINKKTKPIQLLIENLSTKRVKYGNLFVWF